MVTRIRQLLDWQQLSPTQFADLIGVGRPVVSHILSERNKPSLEVVQRIIAAFPTVSLPWLLSGTGEMLAPIKEPPLVASAAVAPAAASAVVTPVVPTAAPITPVPGSVQPTVVVPAPAVAPIASVFSSAPPMAVPAPAIRRFAAPVAPAPARFVVAKAVPSAPKPLATDSEPAEAALLVAEVAPVAPTPPVEASEVAPPVAAAVAPETTAVQQLATEPAPVPAVADTLPPIVPPVPGGGAALLPFLGEPGKAIRRIVIFYRDGSFADYQPEG